MIVVLNPDGKPFTQIVLPLDYTGLTLDEIGER